MSEWKKFELGKVARFQRGVTWSKSQETTEPDAKCVPVLRIPNVQEKLDTTDLVWLRGVREESIRKCAAARDWILMVGSNGNPDRVGNCVLITQPNEFLFASFLVGIEPIQRDKVSPDFLFRLLRGPEVQRYISDDVQGSTGLSNINLARLKAKVVECPRPSEQRRIAEILSTVDEAIEQTEALVGKWQQMKAGLMHDLFTRGVTPESHLRPTRTQAPHLYQNSPLGWIPKDWEPKFLRDVATYQHGQPFPSADYSDEGVLLLRPGNLHVSGIVRFDVAHTTRLPDRWLRTCPELVLKPDDIVMNLTAQSLDDEFHGRVCIVKESEPSLLNQRIARFFPREVNRYFLYWVLRSLQFRNHIDRTTQGTKVQHIYNSDLNRVVLGIPKKIEEQERIHDVLQSITDELFARESEVAKLRQQKKGLMHDLLTGSVRVSTE